MRRIRIFYIGMVLVGIGSTGAWGQLVGISYNGETGNNEFRRVNPVTGGTQILNVFQFASGGYYGLVSDPVAGVAYAPSPGDSLYRFDMTSGAILGVTMVDTPYLSQMELGGPTGFVGFNYNANSDVFEFRSVNPLTGETQVLSTFGATGGVSGFWADPGYGAAYFLQANHLLRFDLMTGANLGSVALDRPLNLKLGAGGMLAGIGYNSDTEQNEFYAVNPLTGTSTFLNAFTFSSGGYSGFFTDPGNGLAYAASGLDLYTFDLASGQVTNIATLDAFMQTYALGPEGAVIPEPTTVGLLALAGLGLWLAARSPRRHPIMAASKGIE